MKWGRKKSASSSTHYRSLISRVFPVSWLVKFKQNGATCELKSRTKKQKIKDTNSNMVSPRKSAYMSRESSTKMKKNSRVKVCYSSTEHQCKIRALEDMKKARRRSKKKKNRGVDCNRVFDSYAVVKCSFAPERDFKESMVEMIRAKGIRRPDELEELLACYLKLNCDKYHDLIIKVFQQVWLFEMNKGQGVRSLLILK